MNRYKVPRIGSDIALYSMYFVGIGCLILFAISSSILTARLREGDKNYLQGILTPLFVTAILLCFNCCLQLNGKNTGNNCLYKICTGDKSNLTQFIDRFVGIVYDPIRFGASVYLTL